MDKEFKEKMYKKLYDSVGFLVTNHSILPKHVDRVYKVNLRLSKKELTKLTDILWYLAHSELWKDNNG